MSGLAVFGLKYPSLLQFDQDRVSEPTLRHNLWRLYGVERVPCDTQLRSMLDPVDEHLLRPAFQAIHQQLQRGKVLKEYAYWDGHLLVAVDGTGQYASSAVSCPQCCQKTPRDGQVHYYHQLLGAVMVHPDRPTVLPLMPEAITHQDGSAKNDCERNAAKRLLRGLRADYPQRALIVVQDSLYSTGPHIQLLQDLDMRFILGVKPGDHAALFAALDARFQRGECEEYSPLDAAQCEHGYRWTNGLTLNNSHPELNVNVLEYWEIQNGVQRVWTWVTDIALRRDNVVALARAGRARWKVENETFNTLKNQGYKLEHNYGHGQQHLSSVLATLMMLAFLIDQAQELGCRVFQAVRAYQHSRIRLWAKLRHLFSTFYLPDWATLWRLLQGEPATPALLSGPSAMVFDSS